MLMPQCCWSSVSYLRESLNSILIPASINHQSSSWKWRASSWSSCSRDFHYTACSKSAHLFPLCMAFHGPKGTYSPQHSTVKTQNTTNRKTNQPGETESRARIGDAPFEHLMKPAASSLITANGLFIWLFYCGLRLFLISILLSHVEIISIISM